MKCISLWQPWATAIALGSKRIETRSWPTPYRGRIAIHAAKRRVVSELMDIQSSWEWRGALHLDSQPALLGDPLQVRGRHLPEILPFGAVVAIATLTDCRVSGSFTVNELRTWRGSHPYRWCEDQMGDFSPGRFGWVLSGIIPLLTPLPWKGEQRWFDVPDDLINAAIGGGK